MTFKEFIAKVKKKRKKSPLPQTDKSMLITSKDMQPTQQLPAATSGNQPSLS